MNHQQQQEVNNFKSSLSTPKQLKETEHKCEKQKQKIMDDQFNKSASTKIKKYFDRKHLYDQVQISNKKIQELIEVGRIEIQAEGKFNNCQKKCQGYSNLLKKFSYKILQDEDKVKDKYKYKLQKKSSSVISNYDYNYNKRYITETITLKNKRQIQSILKNYQYLHENARNLKNVSTLSDSVDIFSYKIKRKMKEYSLLSHKNSNRLQNSPEEEQFYNKSKVNKEIKNKISKDYEELKEKALAFQCSIYRKGGGYTFLDNIRKQPNYKIASLTTEILPKLEKNLSLEKSIDSEKQSKVLEQTLSKNFVKYQHKTEPTEIIIQSPEKEEEYKNLFKKQSIKKQKLSKIEFKRVGNIFLEYSKKLGRQYLSEQDRETKISKDGIRFVKQIVHQWMIETGENTKTISKAIKKKDG